MINNFQEVAQQILVRNGALIEHDGDCIETMFPADIAGILNLPELAHICFDMQTKHDGAFLLTHDTDLFDRLGDLFNEKGRFADLTIRQTTQKYEKSLPAQIENLKFANAVFSHLNREVKVISYLLLSFKYKAISDETREGMSQILINEFNLSTIEDINNKKIDLLTDIQDRQTDQAGYAEKQNLDLVLKAAFKSAQAKTRQELAPFIKSLNRRLNRNVKRVLDYYNAMITEVEQKIKKKCLEGEAKEKELSKIRAIKGELASKTLDLKTQFALNVKTDLISAIRLTVPTTLFWITIKRRKEKRKFALTYNPILKQVDPLPCECCFSPEKLHFVCDDKLHIVCKHCFDTCENCGKQYCHACHSKCPKCQCPPKGL